MIRLTPAEFRLLNYVSGDSPDLSRLSLATVTEVTPDSVSRILTGLKKRGLVSVTYADHRRIEALVPTFFVKKNVTCYLGYPQWQPK